jgi:hypothetical protein
MYRFSINKLDHFKKDVVLLNLFDYYFQSHGDAQITQSKTMRHIPEIYREAALIITSDLHNGNYNAQKI